VTFNRLLPGAEHVGTHASVCGMLPCSAQCGKRGKSEDGDPDFAVPEGWVVQHLVPSLDHCSAAPASTTSSSMPQYGGGHCSCGAMGFQPCSRLSTICDQVANIPDVSAKQHLACQLLIKSGYVVANRHMQGGYNNGMDGFRILRNRLPKP
jgi:hypothetical protein